MIAQRVKIAGELIVPVWNVGRVKEMFRSQIFYRFRQQGLTRFQAEIDFRFPDQFAGLFLQQRHLVFSALFPVFIEPIQVVRQPGCADLQEGELELGKSHRQALADDAGKLQQ